MLTTPPLKKQIVLEDVTCSRRRDIVYRAGLVMQVLGAALLAVLYPLESPFYTVGIMLFESGVLLSAFFLFARMSWIKGTILGAVLAGIALQVAGFYLPEEYAGSVIIGGIGIVCVGAVGMAGKEAYCFKYRVGWFLMLSGFPIMVLINLFGKENHVFNAMGFSALFLVLLTLAGKRFKQPLPMP